MCINTHIYAYTHPATTHARTHARTHAHEHTCTFSKRETQSSSAAEEKLQSSVEVLACPTSLLSRYEGAMKAL